MRTPLDIQKAIAPLPGARMTGSAVLDAHGLPWTVCDVEVGAAWDAAELLVALAEGDLARPAPELVRVAQSFRARYPDDRACAAALLAYVQDRVRFVPDTDPDTGLDLETFQTALYTWLTGEGDCDDSARLLYVLERLAGLPSRLVFLEAPDPETGGTEPVHVYDESVGLAAETTLQGARLGEAPLDAVRRLGFQGRKDITMDRPVSLEAIPTLTIGPDPVDLLVELIVPGQDAVFAVRRALAEEGLSVMQACRIVWGPERWRGAEPITSYGELVAVRARSEADEGVTFPRSTDTIVIRETAAPEKGARPGTLYPLPPRGMAGRTPLSGVASSLGAAGAPTIRYTGYLDAAFFTGLAQGMKARGGDAFGAAALMFAESSLRPDAGTHNAGIALGINQLTTNNDQPPKRPPSSNFSRITRTTFGDAAAVRWYLGLAASEQLPYALAFWDSIAGWKGKDIFASQEALYWANFWPATFSLTASKSPESIVTSTAWAVKQNPGLVLPGENVIRVAGLTRAIQRAQAGQPNTWSEVKARLAYAGASPSGGGSAIPLLISLGLVAYEVAKRYHLI